MPWWLCVLVHIEVPLDYISRTDLWYPWVTFEIQVQISKSLIERRENASSSHILGFVEALALPKCSFRNIFHNATKYLLPNPSSIFIGAGRPWGVKYCWSPKRRVLPVWAGKWWGWRYRCLLGHVPPPCSRNHICKKQGRGCDVNLWHRLMSFQRCGKLNITFSF